MPNPPQIGGDLGVLWVHHYPWGCDPVGCVGVGVGFYWVLWGGTLGKGGFGCCQIPRVAMPQDPASVITPPNRTRGKDLFSEPLNFGCNWATPKIFSPLHRPTTWLRLAQFGDPLK